MVTIPGGPFTMGSNDGPDDERPAHCWSSPLWQSWDSAQDTALRFLHVNRYVMTDDGLDPPTHPNPALQSTVLYHTILRTNTHWCLYVHRVLASSLFD